MDRNSYLDQSFQFSNVQADEQPVYLDDSTNEMLQNMQRAHNESLYVNTIVEEQNLNSTQTANLLAKMRDNFYRQ